MKKMMTLALLLGTQLMGNTFAASMTLGVGSSQESAERAVTAAAISVAPSDATCKGESAVLGEGKYAIPTAADIRIIQETYRVSGRQVTSPSFAAITPQGLMFKGDPVRVKAFRPDSLRLVSLDRKKAERDNPNKFVLLAQYNVEAIDHQGMNVCCVTTLEYSIPAGFICEVPELGLGEDGSPEGVFFTLRKMETPAS